MQISYEEGSRELERGKTAESEKEREEQGEEDKA